MLTTIHPASAAQHQRTGCANVARREREARQLRPAGIQTAAALQPSAPAPPTSSAGAPPHPPRPVCAPRPRAGEAFRRPNAHWPAVPRRDPPPSAPDRTWPPAPAPPAYDRQARAPPDGATTPQPPPTHPQRQGPQGQSTTGSPDRPPPAPTASAPPPTYAAECRSPQVPLVRRDSVWIHLCLLAGRHTLPPHYREGSRIRPDVTHGPRLFLPSLGERPQSSDSEVGFFAVEVGLTSRPKCG
ncbi:hypothetical protein EYS09_11960 [Streptomyces kasugaensis]|uniref:Uncharacterized protein n=1 Tax=Streptomyces kasugaensis TaxID=1946 RepID=A0A4Q9HY15_STRKA|nr:hypothetical protein EYS09_11960 [Streptomyces kasugaensis]